MKFELLPFTKKISRSSYQISLFLPGAASDYFPSAYPPRAKTRTTRSGILSWETLGETDSWTRSETCMAGYLGWSAKNEPKRPKSPNGIEKNRIATCKEAALALTFPQNDTQVPCAAVSTKVVKEKEKKGKDNIVSLSLPPSRWGSQSRPAR